MEKVFNGQSGAFINMEVNTSLDTINVVVSRAQESTLDARTMARLQTDLEERERVERKQRQEELSRRIAALIRGGRNKKNLLNPVAAARARADELRAKRKAWEDERRERTLASRARAAEEARRALGLDGRGGGGDISTDSDESTATDDDADGLAPPGPTADGGIGEARRGLLAALAHVDAERGGALAAAGARLAGTAPPAVLDEDPEAPPPEPVPSVLALLGEIERWAETRVAGREAALGLEPGDLTVGLPRGLLAFPDEREAGGTASVAGSLRSTRSQREARRAAAQRAYAEGTLAGLQSSGGGPRMASARGSGVLGPALPRIRQALATRGLSAPPLCGCPHVGVDPLDGPAWTDGCHDICPLALRPDEHERLALAWCASKGVDVWAETTWNESG